jgi:hypothetical protein
MGVPIPELPSFQPLAAEPQDKSPRPKTPKKFDHYNATAEQMHTIYSNPLFEEDREMIMRNPLAQRGDDADV